MVDKPALVLDGRTLLDVALAAVSPARTVVVGPNRNLDPGVLQTRENPPGGGPAAAVAAGVQRLVRAPPAPEDLVAVLAADLPAIDRLAVEALTTAVIEGGLSGAVLLDPDGRTQYLAGVWRLTELLTRVSSRPSWHGARMSDLVDPLIGARLSAGRRESADIDVAADVEEWGVQLPPTQQPPRGTG